MQVVQYIDLPGPKPPGPALATAGPGTATADTRRLWPLRPARCSQLPCKNVRHLQLVRLLAAIELVLCGMGSLGLASGKGRRRPAAAGGCAIISHTRFRRAVAFTYVHCRFCHWRRWPGLG